MAMRKKKGKNQGDLEGGGGGDGKRGFLFGGSLNPVLGIPNVNSGPISIHSAGYIAEYTCFLLLFGLSLSFSSGARVLQDEAPSSVSLSRAGCAQSGAGAPPVSS